MDKYNLEEIREQLSRNTLYGDAMDVAKFLLGLLDDREAEIDSLQLIYEGR